MKSKKGTSKVEFNIEGLGDRRSDFERRQFSYLYHIPERRVMEDRRNRLDRSSNVGGQTHFAE